MIKVVLANGEERRLEDATVTLQWDDGDESTVVRMESVKALILLGPSLSTMAGMFNGMPVMGVAFTDEANALRIEVPVPLGFANDLGQQLVRDTDRYAAQVKLAGGNGKQALQRYMSLPADLPPTPEH
jgi:hypothetical protein